MDQINISINSSPLSSGHKTRGIGFYTKNLLAYLKQVPELRVTEFTKLSEIKETDVVHFPFFDLFQHSLSWNLKFPTVVTVHDVTPLVFPEHYPPGIKGSINLQLQKFSLKKAGAIITDSEASKQDIIRYFGIKPEKIYVIYLAPAEHFKVIDNKTELKKTGTKFELPEKFALFSGSANWNKNLLNLTESCLRAKMDLVLVGKDFENQNDLDHTERKSYRQFLEKYSKNPLVHIKGFVENDDLVKITNLATLVLLPSFYEGFGLPIVEAQACGIPVITGNIASMPEVAGDGALFIDPDNVNQISQAILEITENPEVALNLKKKGLENIKRFSWKKVAIETLAVYKQVLL